MASSRWGRPIEREETITDPRVRGRSGEGSTDWFFWRDVGEHAKDAMTRARDAFATAMRRRSQRPKRK